MALIINTENFETPEMLLHLHQSPIFNAQKRKSADNDNRTYTVIKRSIEGVVEILFNISGNRARLIANDFRKAGFFVDLIEKSNLTGIVKRNEVPSTDHIPYFEPYLTHKQITRREKISERLLSRRYVQMNKLILKESEKRDSSYLVYEKNTGLLRFSGDERGLYFFLV